MRILVADDSLVIRKHLESLLSDLGHEVSLAEDGEVALRLFEEAPPDLLISDWEMPGRTGIEVCEQIRARSWSKYVPIFIHTTRDSRADYQEAIESGADELIVKPCSSEEFAAHLEQAERIRSQNPT